MRRRTPRQETFSPLRDKTLANVLRRLFITEFGYEKKAIWLSGSSQGIPHIWSMV
jgi:hypothetical protein